MLSKAKYPQLNRAARRHPDRYLRQAKLDKGWAAGGSWLLMGLLYRNGYMPAPTGESEGAVV